MSMISRGVKKEQSMLSMTTEYSFPKTVLFTANIQTSVWSFANIHSTVDARHDSVIHLRLGLLRWKLLIGLTSVYIPSLSIRMCWR